MEARLGLLALVALSPALVACGGEGRGETPPAARTTAAVEDVGAAPVRGCRARNEGRGPIPAPGSGDVVLGPLYFENLAELASEDASTFTPRGGRRYFPIKIPVAVRAGTRATLVVDARARGGAGIDYTEPPPPAGGPFTVANGGAAAELRSCPEDVPSFGYAGTVGPWTQFGGGFLVGGAGCVPVELHVAGRREPHRATLSFGAGDCG